MGGGYVPVCCCDRISYVLEKNDETELKETIAKIILFMRCKK